MQKYVKLAQVLQLTLGIIITLLTSIIPEYMTREFSEFKKPWNLGTLLTLMKQTIMPSCFQNNTVRKTRVVFKECRQR